MFSVIGTNIKLTRGDTLEIQLNLTKNGETYTPADGSVIRFAMKRSYSDSSVVLQKNIPLDTLVLRFEPNDTKSLPMDSVYVYDIELTDENGDVDTFLSGTFYVGNEVL